VNGKKSPFDNVTHVIERPELDGPFDVNDVDLDLDDESAQVSRCPVPMPNEIVPPATITQSIDEVRRLLRMDLDRAVEAMVEEHSKTRLALDAAYRRFHSYKRGMRDDRWWLSLLSIFCLGLVVGIITAIFAR
jgi:hypothetical protein